MNNVTIEGVVLKIDYPNRNTLLQILSSDGETHQIAIGDKKEIALGEQVLVIGSLQTRTLKESGKQATLIVSNKIYKQI